MSSKSCAKPRKTEEEKTHQSFGYLCTNHRTTIDNLFINYTHTHEPFQKMNLEFESRYEICWLKVGSQSYHHREAIAGERLI